MNKVLYVGKAPNRQGRVFLKAEIKDGKFSISGVVGPLPSGNCRGSCGQIIDELLTVRPEGDLTPEQITELHAVWNRWHLNDMNAGSPAQEKFLREHPVEDGYDEAKMALTKANLNPDPNYSHVGGVPYEYGTAWVGEELPEDVITFLESLPETSETYAWV